MKKFVFFISLQTSFMGFQSCNSNENSSDASGVFEATETIISAESSGRLIDFKVEEGQDLAVGEQVGNIDCENLGLQKAQVVASKKALKLKQTSAIPQVEILQEQLIALHKTLAPLKQQMILLLKEQKRVESLVKVEAVPTKQLDDLVGQIEVLKKQIEASESQFNVIRQQIKSQEQQVAIQNRAIMSEQQPLSERLAQMDNLISKCLVINPLDGMVLIKYAEKDEVVSPGKALYKIANLKEMVLRTYITGSQLSMIKINQQVKILVDNGKEDFKELPGTITYISSKAEFTPKTIQTKDERANLVYAVKVKVKNNGFLKIGMYGELKF